MPADAPSIPIHELRTGFMKHFDIDPATDVSHISGNASDDTKRIIRELPTLFSFKDPKDGRPAGFAASVVRRLRVVEVSVLGKKEDERKRDGVVVVEVDALEDTLNGGANVHGGCHAFLIDLCSTLALDALKLETNGQPSMTVTQSLNIVYHAPAPGGVKLKIINTTIAAGARTASMRTEIWDATNRRLTSTGIHVKMNPTTPYAIAKGKL